MTQYEEKNEKNFDVAVINVSDALANNKYEKIDDALFEISVREIAYSCMAKICEIVSDIRDLRMNVEKFAKTMKKITINHGQRLQQLEHIVSEKEKGNKYVN